MKIDLKSYRDLGKCAYATLKEIFDTDTDRIFVMINGTGLDTSDFAEVKISSVDDLIPFLWSIPFLSSADKSEGTRSYFITPVQPWWELKYNPVIEDASDEIKRMMKSKARKETIDNRIKTEQERIEWATDFIIKHNEDMHKLIEQIRKDNE